MITAMHTARGIICFVGCCALGYCAHHYWGAAPHTLTERPPADAEPFFDGLGTYSRRVRTDSALAQRYFDQGLMLLYSFNREEACRSFEAAIAADPDCAMAYWGIALGKGPDINEPTVDDVRARKAWKAAMTARTHAVHATPVERDLIEAAAKRYADPPPEQRDALNKAYADAMCSLWKSHPEDPDVGALAAEAMLDLRPWDQWDADGRPQPGTKELIQILDEVLAKYPQHPFAPPSSHSCSGGIASSGEGSYCCRPFA